MNINNKLALLVYFTCNTYYKEPVLELNLKNKDSVKIINLHTLTFCRHDDDNQYKIKWDTLQTCWDSLCALCCC